MKIILSPAKSMDFENAKDYTNTSVPHFIKESAYLANKLKKQSVSQLKKLMNVSDAIATLNVERFLDWEFPFKNGQAKTAMHVFTGEAYRGLDALNFTGKELELAQHKLRILSGLYGILRPMDLMLPYRLEMGTRYKVTPTKTNLYKFWGDQITKQLKSEMHKDEVLVNVASKEYFKVIDFKKLDRKVITCHFKELKNNEYKTIMVFAKRARGAMSRFIIENDLEDPEHLKGFDTAGYAFKSDLSTDTDYVFVR